MSMQVHPHPLPSHQSSLKKFIQKIPLSNIVLYLGAGLSIIDLLFDFAMVREYYNADQPKFATATLVTIFLNVFFTVFITVIQHFKHSKLVILRECLYVVTFIKPGLDAHRVVQGKQHEVDAFFDPKGEMLIGRVVELFAECIPGAVIQTMSFVNGPHSHIAILSLTSSILTASFISATITIEKDIDSKSRSHSPNYYGFINLISIPQTLTVCMLVLTMAACQLASKSFAVVLANVESTNILVLYITVDVGFAFLVKVARSDFMYWVPIQSYFVRWCFSFAVRLTTKITADFAGTLQFRHPLENGGLHFMMTIFMTPFVCLYFGGRYLRFVEEEENRASMNYVFESSQIYGGLGALACLQFLCFVTFMLIIPRKYRASFWSTKTGSQFVIDKFAEAGDENASVKIDVFENHICVYKEIEQEVRVWLNEHLRKWVDEEVEWFDDQKKSLIPDDFVDDKVLLLKIRGIEVEKILKKRRNSIGGWDGTGDGAQGDGAQDESDQRSYSFMCANAQRGREQKCC
ncbi:hypothetical protein TL16_g08170 [Triparma laevis f. inornata]|uniref:Uncharacterized protein n=1 Tax=Triparma laevis f. inornata TaxID=1714386 RepID=A0A9W7B2W7_9STRA|nr:hypothetical protein TL16_g08170 [Triparma laevis f. inornata]